MGLRPAPRLSVGHGTIVVVILFLVLVAVLLTAAVVAMVIGRTGQVSVAMSEPAANLGGRGLVEGEPLTSDALDRVVFDRSLRGYRMDQVDAVLDRIQVSLAEREADLAEREAALEARDPRTASDIAGAPTSKYSGSSATVGPTAHSWARLDEGPGSDGPAGELEDDVDHRDAGGTGRGAED